ncbi:MAG: hypothetical protein ACON5B_11190 [Myxococcota bacterium]
MKKDLRDIKDSLAAAITSLDVQAMGTCAEDLARLPNVSETDKQALIALARAAQAIASGERPEPVGPLLPRLKDSLGPRDSEIAFALSLKEVHQLAHQGRLVDASALLQTSLEHVDAPALRFMGALTQATLLWSAGQHRDAWKVGEWARDLAVQQRDAHQYALSTDALISMAANTKDHGLVLALTSRAAHSLDTLLGPMGGARYRDMRAQLLMEWDAKTRGHALVREHAYLHGTTIA